MPEVSALMKLNNGLVRKWGPKLVAVQDYSEPVPTTFFDENGLPILPPSAKQLGLITTDGIVAASSVSTEATNMDQQVEAVRSDVTGIEKSMTGAFGESSNAWLHALRAGKQVADWPADPKAPWSVDDGDFVDFPYYRLFLIASDGVGDQAFYRVEYGYRVKVSTTADRTLARNANENLGFTFGFFRDPVANKSLYTAENGPGFGVAPTP